MQLYEFDAERFSRWMAYVLRHNPTRYGLQPDRHGYVDLEGFMLIAKRRYPGLSPEQIRSLVETGGTGRFEISDNRLRARYGHSIPVEPPGLPVKPPLQLYHGSETGHIEAILAAGLQPSDRSFLHCSETAEEALAIARRKSDRPAVVRIMAQEAHEAGIAFFSEGKMHLVARIPPQFLRLESSVSSVP